MQLLDYIDDKALTFKDMAAMTGQANEVTVWRHAHGHRMPSPSLIAVYETATGGMVRLKDWLALKERVELARAEGAAGTKATKGVAAQGAHP